MGIKEDRRYREDWAKIIKKYLDYKQPYLINGTYFEKLDDDTEIIDKDENS